MKKYLSLALAMMLVIGAIVVMPTEAKASNDYTAMLQYVNGDWSVNYQNSTELTTTVNGAGTYTITVTPKDLKKEGETIYGIGFMKLKLFCAYKELKVAELTDLKVKADGVEVALDFSKIVEHTAHWSDNGAGTWLQDKAWILSQNWEDGGFGPVDIFTDASAVSFAEKLEVTFTLKVDHTAMLVGNFGDTTFVDDAGKEYTIGNWDVADTDAVLTYLGDGIYAKTFKFAAPLAADFVAGDNGYKVAFDGAWDYNFGKDGKWDGENIALTVPAGATEFTIVVDEPNNGVYDSINNKAKVEEILAKFAPEEETESSEVEEETESGSEKEEEIDKKGDFADMGIYMVVLMGAALVIISAVAKKKMA